MGLIADIHKDLERGVVQLIVEYRGRLRREALNLCKDESMAEDLAFRTFERVLDKIDTYKDDTNLFGWMRTIMENIYRNDLRGPVARRTKSVDADELERCAGEDWSTDEQILNNSDSEAIRKAISELDPKYNQVLLMRYYDGISLQQIADLMRLPRTTVSWRLHVAHRLLAGKLSVVLGRTKKPLAILATILSFTFIATAAAVATVPALAPVRDAVAGLFAEGESGETSEPISAADVPKEGLLAESAETLPSVVEERPSAPVVEEPQTSDAATISSPKQNTANTNKEKTKTMNIKKIAAAAVSSLLSMAAGADGYTWLPATANTETTPYLWNDTTKWKDGKVPVTGVDSEVNMLNVTVPSQSATQYVQVPEDGLTFGSLSITTAGRPYLHFQGGPMRFEKTSGTASLTFPGKRVFFHQKLSCSGDLKLSLTDYGYLYNGLSVDGILEFAGGKIHLSPKTASATNGFPRGVWKLNGGVAALNANAQTIASVPVLQEIEELRVAQAGTLVLKCRSGGASSESGGSFMVYLHARKLTGSAALTLDDDNHGNNWVGTLMVDDVSGFTGTINGCVGRLWFTPGPDDSRTPYLKKYSLTTMNSDNIRGRIGIPGADVNVILGTMSLVDAMGNTPTRGAEFYKTGAGKLTVSNYVQVANPQYGIIDVQQGTLWLRSESGAIVQPNLIVDSDAVLEVSPDTTLTVNNATLMSPFTLGGGGRLVVLGGARPAKIILRDGATISFPNQADALSSDDGIVPEVAGDPAFWVDASRKDSIEFNTGSTLRFHRWNDCRKTSEDDGYMYAATADQYPEYEVPAEGKAYYPAWRKDPSPNKMGFVHIQRRSARWDKWESLYWNKALTNIRCVFMVCGTYCSSPTGTAEDDSQIGGGYFLGNGPQLKTGSFGRFNLGSWDVPIIQNPVGGTWYRDGMTVVPTDKNSYRPGFQLVEAVNVNASGAQSFGASVTFSGSVPSTAADNACGRNRICECIIYTNTLTEVERKATAEYLYRKWFRRPYPGILASSPASAVSSVTIANGGTIEAAQDMAVASLAAEGDFTKTGTGTLFVSVSDAASNMTAAEGRLTLKSAPSRGKDLPRAWFHADATRADTFVAADAQDGKNSIRRWRDCNGGAVSLFTTANRMRQPFVSPNALNGLPVVDFGAMDTADDTVENQTVLFFQDGAVRSESYDDKTWTTNRNFRDVFVVWGSANGGNDFMTAEGVSSWSPFPRSSRTVASGNLLSGLEKDANRLAVWRKNGEQAIDPSATGLSGTYDLVSFHGQDVSNAFRACSFGFGSSKETGGLQLAEVLVYTNALSQEEVLCVETYLRRKWFGVETAGRVPSSVAGVTALADATLAVEGSLDVGKVGGAGTVVKGNVNLADGGVIELQVNADGTVSPLTVAAPATLVALGGGTIRLTGDVAQLGINRQTAVLGNVTFPAGFVWMVENAPKKRPSEAKVVNGKLIFCSSRCGMAIFVR